MKEMTQTALEAALLKGETVKYPVRVKTNWATTTKYGRVTVLSYILDYDEYVDSTVMRDVCFLFKGRLRLLETMVTPAESLDSAIKRQISRQEAYYNRRIAVA